MRVSDISRLVLAEPVLVESIGFSEIERLKPVGLSQLSTVSSRLDIVVTTISTLNSEVQFGAPFIVEGGDVSRVSDSTVWAPDVFYDSDNDIEITSDEWEALTGYTGQYGYNGAVMHPSEFLGGCLARDILAEDSTIFVVVEVMDYDDVDDIIGWVVLRYTGTKGPVDK